MRKVNLEKDTKTLGPYAADLQLVKDKIEKAKYLCEQIDCLIAEAASGGKHDTGCFADEFSDLENQSFDHTQRKIRELLQSLKVLSKIKIKES